VIDTGIDFSHADAHYLKLDGTNGPITSNLGVTGTISAASVSAIDISGTTLNVGNISNTEFGRLDGVSANIQTQLSNLSGTGGGAIAIFADTVQVTSTGTLAVNGGNGGNGTNGSAGAAAARGGGGGGGGGGAGSGGSLYLKAATVTLGSSLVTPILDSLAYLRIFRLKEVFR
jgi:hypothetical protein